MSIFSKKIKKITTILLLILVFSSETFSAYANNSYTDFSLETLNKMSGEECIAELKKVGYCVPDIYNNAETTALAVKTIITDLHSGHFSTAVPYNYTALASMALDIQKVILDNDTIYASTYVLQDSTVYGSWLSSYLNYNCYGYAINKTSAFIDPGHYSGRDFNMGLTTYGMASIIAADLNALGYSTYITTNKPTSIASKEKIVCINKGTIDYHVMKGITGVNIWRHKPGSTNPLRWNYTSPEHKDWTNEYSIYNVSYPGTTSYFDDVYYVVYWVANTGVQNIIY